MYFVNTREKIKSSNFLLHLLPAGTVLITVLGLTLLGWRNARVAYHAERQTAIDQTVTSTQLGIQERLDTYELVLIGASGLFASSAEVTRNEWRDYVATFNLENSYPGIQGLGYAEHATPSEIPSIVRSAQADGLKDFSVFPAGSRKEYAVNLYFEPQDNVAFGFDLFSEPTRLSALTRARQTGESSITGKLNFVASKGRSEEPGFVMYLPAYVKGSYQTEPLARREIKGYVYAPFTMGGFFGKTFENTNNDKHSMRIYDTSASKDNLLYEASNFSALDNEDSFRHTSSMEIFGREWLIDFRFSPDIVADTTRSSPISSLVVGTMLSFLLSGFVLTLLVTRTRVLAHTKHMEVQSAKDELLSLASHQLRTPATSVKQYLGMALEGFAGKLSTQQSNLLEKAYESNERQLHIINEILYVAKIDAKGIVLTPRRLNVNKLLRDLTQELSATAKKNRQKIRLQMPMKQIYIEADEHCLRMAMENLISNALKYSYEDTTVSVKLTTSKDEIRFIVKDKGVGIDAKDLPLLFNRFSRIPNELSRQTSGSGIGLYLSQQLIELHNGKIEVESTKGKGTVFTVIMPKTHKTAAQQT